MTPTIVNLQYLLIEACVISDVDENVPVIYFVMFVISDVNDCAQSNTISNILYVPHRCVSCQLQSIIKYT